MEQIFLDSIFWFGVVYVVAHLLEMTLSLTRVLAGRPGDNRRGKSVVESFCARCSFDRLPEQIASIRTIM